MHICRRYQFDVVRSLCFSFWTFIKWNGIDAMQNKLWKVIDILILKRFLSCFYLSFHSQNILLSFSIYKVERFFLYKIQNTNTIANKYKEDKSCVFQILSWNIYLFGKSPDLSGKAYLAQVHGIFNGNEKCFSCKIFFQNIFILHKKD